MAYIIEQGDFCPQCKNHIPRFPGLTETEETRIRDLSPVNAMKELHELTGCGIATAKIWALHPTGPHAAKIHPPCPYCGKALISTESRQCLLCGWDWHDSEHPVQRAATRPDVETLKNRKAERWQRYRDRKP
jgi:hypothetical protein